MSSQRFPPEYKTCLPWVPQIGPNPDVMCVQGPDIPVIEGQGFLYNNSDQSLAIYYGLVLQMSWSL